MSARKKRLGRDLGGLLSKTTAASPAVAPAADTGGPTYHSINAFLATTLSTPRRTAGMPRRYPSLVIPAKNLPAWGQTHSYAVQVCPWL